MCSQSRLSNTSIQLLLSGHNTLRQNGNYRTDSGDVLLATSNTAHDVLEFVTSI